jgi:hypothetical protein
MNPPDPMNFQAAVAKTQRRRHGRVLADDVQSTVGHVLDLSASGMRVRCGRRAPEVGRTLEVGIQGAEGPFLVRARVVWVSRRGVMTSEAGLEFDGPDDHAKAELAALARQSVSAPTLIRFRAAA